MTNNINESEKDTSLLLACYGAKSFVKIYQALEIDKIKFSFVTKGKEKDPIDIYISAEEFQADLIAQIEQRQLEKNRIAELSRAKTVGDKNCKDIWESRAGKSPKNTIRKFSIQPGQNMEYVFIATESSENGKSNSKYIIVGCSSKDLKLLAFRWSFLYEDYKKILKKRYSMAEMKSPYHAREGTIGQDVPYDDLYIEESISYPKLDHDSDQTKKDTQTQGIKPPNRPLSLGSDDIANNTIQDNKSKAPDNVPKGEILHFKLKIKTPMAPLQSGKYALEGYTQNNVKYAVIFDPSMFQSDNNSWEKFYKTCAKAGNMICFSGIVKGDRILATAIH